MSALTACGSSRSTWRWQRNVRTIVPCFVRTSHARIAGSQPGFSISARGLRVDGQEPVVTAVRHPGSERSARPAPKVGRILDRSSHGVVAGVVASRATTIQAIRRCNHFFAVSQRLETTRARASIHPRSPVASLINASTSAPPSVSSCTALPRANTGRPSSSASTIDEHGSQRRHWRPPSSQSAIAGARASQRSHATSGTVGA